MVLKVNEQTDLVLRRIAPRIVQWNSIYDVLISGIRIGTRYHIDRVRIRSDVV